MTVPRLSIVCLFFLAAGFATHASAQGKPPAPPPLPPPAGMPPGPPSSAGPPGSHPPGNNPPAGNTTSPGSNGAPRSGLQFGPVGRWWDDKSVVRTIGLRQDQQRKMDEIFNANKPAILSSYKVFLSEQAKLDALSKQANADKTKMFAAIDAVSQARAALQKANTQMLLQLREQMQPDQIEKLEKLQ